MGSAPTPKTAPQTLLLDADDTLWENNVYFERAIGNFISFLNHRDYTPEQVRDILFAVERESVLTHGYGIHSFAHSLVQTFERLSVEPVTPELHQTILSFAHQIAEHPVELIAGVAETLQYLAGQGHHLMMVTKGNITEQSGKIERSGLKDYFAAIEIVAEKDEPVYRGIVERYALDPDTSWMVGNSPKSDINPAIAAGLNAVFIPHDQTWMLERAEIAQPSGQRPQLLVLDNFAELATRF
jgi:putative hydrolase of the HAD superfamily